MYSIDTEYNSYLDLSELSTSASFLNKSVGAYLLIFLSLYPGYHLEGVRAQFQQ